MSNKPVIAFNLNPEPLQMSEKDIPQAYLKAMDSLILEDDPKLIHNFVRFASVKNGHLCPAC
jgi:hypothetical protein